MLPVPPVMGLELPVAPPPPLTSFCGCRSRTLMCPFFIRRLSVISSPIESKFAACCIFIIFVSFVVEKPAHPRALPDASSARASRIAKRTGPHCSTEMAERSFGRKNGSASEIRSTPRCFKIVLRRFHRRGEIFSGREKIPRLFRFWSV